MKIRQQDNGKWVIEHKDRPVPYTVLCTGPNQFDLFYIHDPEPDIPFIEGQSAEQCESYAEFEYFNLYPVPRGFYDP